MSYNFWVAGRLPVFALLLVGIKHSTPCSAQQSLPPQQTAETRRVKMLQRNAHFTAAKTSLQAALAMLHKEYGLNFVVDGKPITLQKDVDVTGTLQDALDTLADDFDYKWTITQSGIILMNKRFHNQQELPQVNLPEIKQAARDMDNALAAFDPHTDPASLGDMIFDVAIHLSAEQVRALRAGKRVPVTDLPAAQYSLAKSAMLNACFARTCRTWQDLLPLLDALPAAYLDATYYQSREDYTLCIAKDGKRFPHPFSLSPSKIISAAYPEK